MPKRLEKALKQSAKRKGLREGTPHYNRYVHGTMAKLKKQERKSNDP